MPKVKAHKIASATCGLITNREVEIGDTRQVAIGDVIVVEALEEKRVYDKLELISGRLAKISKGDILVGVIGARRSLRGFVGHAPKTVRVGEALHILNMGGVIGVCTSANLDYGAPLRVKVLGLAMRDGKTLNIGDGAIPPSDKLTCQKPLVVIAGTCMAAGKTRAACEIIAQLNQRGFRFGGLKLSGVAALRDTLNMEDHGAIATLSFLHAGHPSTAGFVSLAPMAKGLLNQLGKEDVHAIVIEMGDGIIGGYGVDTFYRDPEIRAAITCHVMCANDLVAAWGARSLCEKTLGRPIDVMSGPATDNEVGEAYVDDELQIPAANARTKGTQLADLVAFKCFGRLNP